MNLSKFWHLYGAFPPVFDRLLPWVFFWGFFVYGWRVRNPFTHIPGYGDVLEVLWGIQWYHESLLVKRVSPLFTPLVFHPLGWHTATLAHTPTFFLIAQSLYPLGGAAFASNILSVVALIVAFGGMVRLARCFVSLPVAIAIALAFLSIFWGRLGGHLHMMWVFALLPWLVWAIGREIRPTSGYRWGILCGVIWGLMINFQLYGSFIGALAFVFWGRRIFRAKYIRQAVIAALTAFVLGLPVMALYLLGSRADQTHYFGIEHNMWWGASLNSLFIPPVFHPIAFIRDISRTLYIGPHDESGVMNFGLTTSWLALIGAVVVLKTKRQHTGLLWLTLTGILLGLGLLLRWNGEVLQYPIFRPLNAGIWWLGHKLKPALFPTPNPTSYFESGVPLPGFLLTAVIPFWEGARTVSRYAVLGMLGAVVLAGIALQHFPKGMRYLITVVWLVEMLPRPTGNVPVPSNLHPAYAWVAGQELEPGEGIADIAYPTLEIGGETLWAIGIHNKPNVSGAGSFWPEHTFVLWNYLLDSTALSRPETGVVFRQYGVRYVFLHMRGEKERRMWEMVQENPAFRAVDCWDPLSWPTPWPYSICVAEVLPVQGPVRVLLGKGWSGREEWGVWAEGLRSEAGWLAVAQDGYRLRIGAFPFCVPRRHQEMSIWVNGERVGEHRWENCDYWEGEVQIPVSVVKRGWNRVTFEYAYAMSPFEVTQGQNGDRRMLSVGFTVLEVTK